MDEHFNLKIWADYRSHGIFDYATGIHLRQKDIMLPDSIWQDLEKWCESYQFVIRLTQDERIKILNKINELDIEGIRIRDEIRKIRPTYFQIHYYSEGLYKYLNDDMMNICGMVDVEKSQ